MAFHERIRPRTKPIAPFCVRYGRFNEGIASKISEIKNTALPLGLRFNGVFQHSLDSRVLMHHSISIVW